MAVASDGCATRDRHESPAEVVALFKVSRATLYLALNVGERAVSLLREIQNDLASTGGDITTVLRKCKILASLEAMSLLIGWTRNLTVILSFSQRRSTDL